jgi:2-polyprenyl-3-methyl-5-hydroxy-6-metoxy-1,4-benzoquinol methylase
MNVSLGSLALATTVAGIVQGWWWALLALLGGGVAAAFVSLTPGRKKASRKPFRPYIPPGVKLRDVPSDSRGKRIGILVVAYNALTTLSAVLKRIPPDVWEQIEEVAVFDDASPDETYELAVGHKKLFGRDKLTLFRNERNLGYGGNQKRGYKYFMDKGFDIVVMLHGDGQYAPEVLAHLYAPLVADEADAVFGSRMLPDYGGPLKGGMPLYKFIGNKILTGFANALIGTKLSEYHSGYRAYSLHALKQIDFTHMTDDFHFDTQIILKLHHQGMRIREVPIPTYYGDEICYVNGMKYARDVARAVLRYRRTAAGLGRAPEYQEYHVHYPLKQSRYSSHYYFRRLAGSDRDLLDVGCGEGFFAASIADLGNRVVGIDRLDQPACRHALAGYVAADLDGGLGPALPKLHGKRFDLVMLQDVLEHLRSPEKVLRDCVDLLKPNGRVAVSLPNVANITVRLALLLGQFRYTERGILDRTHLRFYTRSTAKQLLQDAGYEVESVRMTVMPIELVLGFAPTNPAMRALTETLRLMTAIFPGLLGYQTVLVVRPKALATLRAVETPLRRAA